MYRTILILLTATALAAPATCQETSKHGVVPQHLGLETVIGCLSKGPDGTFALTGGAPGPKQFRIISGDLAPLKNAVGQDVEVLGIVGKNDPRANQDDPYNSGSTTGVGYLTIQAQQVKKIGAACSLPGKEWVGDHMNKK